MTLVPQRIPIDPELDRKLKLWLAAPEAEKVMECLAADAAWLLTGLMNDTVAQDLQPNSVTDREDRLRRIRHLRDWITTLQDLRRQTEPFCLLSVTTQPPQAL